MQRTFYIHQVIFVSGFSFYYNFPTFAKFYVFEEHQHPPWKKIVFNVGSGINLIKFWGGSN